MYDTIKFVIKESELDNAICFLEEIPCRISIKSTSSNRVVGFLKNMKIEVRNTTLIVQGSLLKYFKGYNYAECLSVWDVRKSINKLSNELNVPMRQAVINRIDIGICFSMVNVPWVYWDCLLHSDGYFRSNIKQETLYFDKYDSQLCFYDKKTRAGRSGLVVRQQRFRQFQETRNFAGQAVRRLRVQVCQTHVPRRQYGHGHDKIKNR